MPIRMHRPRTARRHLVIVGLLVSLLVTDGAAADVPAHPGLLGLLEIASLLEPWRPDHVKGHALVLKKTPSALAATVSSVSAPGELETHESGYEQPAAAVYGYRHAGAQAWYRLRALPSGGLGWIAAEHVGTFHPLSELITESLAYLTGEWDHHLYQVAGRRETAQRLDVQGNEIPVAVAASAQVGDATWFLVMVLEESVCESADAPGVLAAGWVPAQSSRGRLNAWFYSRGC